MDIRYCLLSIASRLDPKLTSNQKYITKLSNRLNPKRSALKARNFNTTLICQTTIDEIYNGLSEKYIVQSDLGKAEELTRLYEQLSAVDFDKIFKSEDTKFNMLYFLFKASTYSSSFVNPNEGVVHSNVEDEQVLEDPCDTTVCMVDWREELLAGEEFKIRTFVLDDNDEEEEEKDAEEKLPCNNDNSRKDVHNDEMVNVDANQSVASSNEKENAVRQRISYVENMARLAKACGRHQTEVTKISEFSFCNRVLCAMSGAVEFPCNNSFITDGKRKEPILNHLTNGCLTNYIHSLSDKTSSSLQHIQLLHSKMDSFDCDYLADVGMACGSFLIFLTDSINNVASTLQPVTLLNLDFETAALRKLICLFGRAVESLSRNSSDISLPSSVKTQRLIGFAHSIQSHLEASLVCCDTVSASWLLYLWFSTVRPLLRASIQTIFTGHDKTTVFSHKFSWFDETVFMNDSVVLGNMTFTEVHTVLSATYRYVIMLRQCREEAGDFLCHSKLLALPGLLEHTMENILEQKEGFSPNVIDASNLLSPALPSTYYYALPVDIVEQLTTKWMSALKAECKKSATHLYQLWKSAGLDAWMLALRLVFFCQSVSQFDGRYKFLKRSSSALDLLILNLPKDVWMEVIPPQILKAMVQSCEPADVLSTSDGIDDLAGSLTNCKTVAEALEFLDSANESTDRLPLVLFPISLFLCPEVLSKYVKVHSFLVAFHVSKNWLSRSFFNADPLSSCYGKYASVRALPRPSRSTNLLTPADRLLWLLRSAVFFALSALQQYFFTSVICASCHRLQKDLENVTSADDLERIHNELLSTVVAGCLFPVGHRTYQASLRHLIVLADMLSRQQVTLLKQQARNPATVNLTVTQWSEDSTLLNTTVGSETSWKLLSTDTYQGICFLADTLARSAGKNYSLSRSSLNSSLYDAEMSSSSLGWLATELQHASHIVSEQSKILLKLMHISQ